MKKKKIINIFGLIGIIAGTIGIVLLLVMMR